MTGNKLSKAKIKEIIQLCTEKVRVTGPPHMRGTISKPDVLEIAAQTGVSRASVQRYWTRHKRRYKSPRVHKETRAPHAPDFIAKRRAAQAGLPSFRETIRTSDPHDFVRSRKGSPLCKFCEKSRFDSLHQPAKTVRTVRDLQALLPENHVFQQASHLKAGTCAVCGTNYRDSSHVPLTDAFAKPRALETSADYARRTGLVLSDWYDRKKNPASKQAPPHNRVDRGEAPSPNRAETNGTASAYKAAFSLFDANLVRDLRDEMHKAFNAGDDATVTPAQAWACFLALHIADGR